MYTADLASQGSVSILVRKILADGHSIHILLNCGDTQRQHPSHLFPDGDWNEVLQFNLTNAFIICREVGTHMLARKPDALGRRGSIINLTLPVLDEDGRTMAASAASLGGVSQLTKALSNEWAAKGVRVNAIALEDIASESTAMFGNNTNGGSAPPQSSTTRSASSDALMSSLIYLASQASGYVTGTVLTVHGSMARGLS